MKSQVDDDTRLTMLADVLHCLHDRTAAASRPPVGPDAAGGPGLLPAPSGGGDGGGGEFGGRDDDGGRVGLVVAGLCRALGTQAAARDLCDLLGQVGGGR
jgi:hypothetical protein